jgi:hypothetical protein
MASFPLFLFSPFAFSPLPFTFRLCKAKGVLRKGTGKKKTFRLKKKFRFFYKNVFLLCLFPFSSLYPFTFSPSPSPLGEGDGEKARKWGQVKKKKRSFFLKGLLCVPLPPPPFSPFPVPLHL